MYKSYKAYLLCLIIFLLYLNFNYILNIFYCYTFSEVSIRVTLIRAIPLLILSLCYFFMSRYSEKLSINFSLLILSLFSLVAVQIHKFLYYHLLIDNIDTNFVCIMYLFFIAFLISAFFKNFDKRNSIVIFLLFILPISFFIQLFIVFVTDFEFQLSSYTNPNRYEFVKYHYLTDKEFSVLPSELPSDATNIVFEYSELMNTKTIHLEYNSMTIDNEEHYIKYDISFSKEEK